MKKLLFLILMSFSLSVNAETLCMVGGSVVAGIGDRGTYWRSRIKYHRPDISFVGNYGAAPYKHDGVGGDKTTDILNRIDTITGCDTAVIHVGGNDLLAGVRGGVVAQNVRAIADALQARGITPKIQTILPLNSTASDATYWNGVINWTNDAIKSAVSADYQTVDSWLVFHLLGGGTPEGDGLYVDSVHPSYAGYYYLAKSLSGKY